MQVDALVLAGGRSSRLGGVDKALLEVVEGASARTLVARACEQVAFARRRVVVGPVSADELPADVRAVREDPPFGGPAAALGAGTAALGDDAADWLVVLACDMPDVGAAVAELTAALDEDPPTDAVVCVDEEGHRQWLAAAYRIAALRERLREAAPLHGQSLRAVVGGLDRREIMVAGPALADLDTWEAVHRRGHVRVRPEGEIHG